jgi:hypothetical protein
MKVSITDVFTWTTWYCEHNSWYLSAMAHFVIWKTCFIWITGVHWSVSLVYLHWIIYCKCIPWHSPCLQISQRHYSRFHSEWMTKTWQSEISGFRLVSFRQFQFSISWKCMIWHLPGFNRTTPCQCTVAELPGWMVNKQWRKYGGLYETFTSSHSSLSRKCQPMFVALVAEPWINVIFITGLI